MVMVRAASSRGIRSLPVRDGVAVLEAPAHESRDGHDVVLWDRRCVEYSDPAGGPDATPDTHQHQAIPQQLS